MTGRLSSFADLLIPVRPETFFERYWESQPLHIQRSESDYYARLLTDRDVEAAISSGGLRYPAIQLAKGGGFFLPRRSPGPSVREVIFSPVSPTSIAFAPSINPVLPFRCRGSTGLGGRSARSPPQSRRSSTMQYTQTSTSLLGTPSVSVPITTRTNPVFVQSTDADGNALGGIRHPLLAAPSATHVGWSLRASGYGEGELFTVQGSMIPFAQTEAERERALDPRPSLEARYASRDAWAARLAEAVHRLVAERLLLAEDGDRLAIAARESWDVYREL
jgi:hypothetical protein